jgi:hypothetical protein
VNNLKSLNSQNECIPDRDMDFVGLMSSSVNSGSRTDTGLGRSGISTALSRFSTFLLIKELEGDADGEDGICFSSCDSCKKTNNCSDKCDRHVGPIHQQENT